MPEPLEKKTPELITVKPVLLGTSEKPAFVLRDSRVPLLVSYEILAGESDVDQKLNSCPRILRPFVEAHQLYQSETDPHVHWVGNPLITENTVGEAMVLPLAEYADVDDYGTWPTSLVEYGVPRVLCRKGSSPYKLYWTLTTPSQAAHRPPVYLKSTQTLPGRLTTTGEPEEALLLASNEVQAKLRVLELIIGSSKGWTPKPVVMTREQILPYEITR